VKHSQNKANAENGSNINAGRRRGVRAHFGGINLTGITGGNSAVVCRRPRRDAGCELRPGATPRAKQSWKIQ
jgi:hypothetical protein